MRRSALVCLTLLLASVPLSAEKKKLTIDDLYDPEKRLRLSATQISGVSWLDDRRIVYPKLDANGEMVRHAIIDVTTGAESALFDVSKLERSLIAGGVSATDAKSAAKRRSLLFDRGKQRTLFEIGGRSYLYDVTTGESIAISAPDASGAEESTFSPDGSHIAFIRGNDLWITDARGRERRLTTGGSEELLNGKLDWVYQEEIYGRGRYRAYWWSPDSKRIAFLRFDESPVREFVVVDHIPYLQKIETTNYPKAGDPNPRVTLHVVEVASGRIVDVDLSRYSSGEYLISNVDWSPDNRVFFQIQNREQTWLDMNFADPISGKPDFLVREQSKAWVEMIDNPTWLADSSFLWQSERTGWRHLYHYSRDGKLIRPVTSGEWEVRQVHGVDEKKGVVFITATERTPIGTDIYRISLDGKNLTRLSSKPGTHVAEFNPSLTRYVDTWSDFTTPSQLRVHDRGGREIRLLDANDVRVLTEYDLPPPQHLQVKTRDGFSMEALLIRPPDFDPTKKYPVYQHIYGGPHAPQVVNRWGGTTYLFHQLLAQRGIVVWILDNRTASGKGAVSAWPVYKNFGELELRDVEDGLTWLRSQPWVDSSRIMINGWSYGGFMASYALTHSKSFKAGIAGGMVSDWRDYDTIYTERYMGLPSENEEAYRKSSPRFAAANLHGDLLLLHGTMDDNVHVQNTIQFAYELQKAGKRFEMMLYPKSRHGVTDPKLLKHMRMTMLDFIERQLLAKQAPGVVVSAP